jgi:small multidrug resistance pump
MNNNYAYFIIYMAGIIASCFAQVMLKRSAGINRERWIFDYLNFRVIFAYTIFFFATFCTVYAYKRVPLSMGPILGATEYFFAALLSRIILKEHINRKKLIGLCMILTGVMVYSI